MINGVATDVVTLLRVDPSLVAPDPLAAIAATAPRSRFLRVSTWPMLRWASSLVI